MKTYLDAKPHKKQHIVACGDCPFRRIALPGWLADKTPAEYVQIAHMNGLIECHTKKKAFDHSHHQCAGAAIYRANICKKVGDDGILSLPANNKTIFSTPKEFVEYHLRRSITDKEMQKMAREAFEKQIIERSEA